MKNKKFINIGSCDFSMEGWLTLDKPSHHYVSRQAPIDLPHDLMSFSPINLPDKSIEIAYSSHTIEHLSDIFVNHLFKEVYRIMEDGGTFRIACPDIGRCYDAYVAGDEEYISNWLLNPAGHKKFRSHGIGERFLFIFASYVSPYRDHIRVNKCYEQEIKKVFESMSKQDALTYFTSLCQQHAPTLQSQYPGEHISWWDYEKLKIELEKVGFKNISKQEYNESNNPNLCNFDCQNTDNTKTLNYTVFVECTK